MKKIIVLSLLLPAVLMFIWQCSTERKEPLSKSMTEELALLPQSSAGTGYINIQNLRESSFYEMMQHDLSRSPFHSQEYQEFMDATGLDLRKDIQEIYFCVSPKKGDEKAEFLAVIKGSFDPEKIMNYIAKEEVSKEIVEEDYHGQPFYQLNKKQLAFTFLEKSRLIFGKAEMVRGWLDENSAGKKTSLSAELEKQINSLKYKSGAWFTLDAKMLAETLSEEIDRHAEGRHLAAMEALQDFNFSLKADKELWFSGIGNFSDNEKANLFNDALKGLIAAAKLSVSDDRQAVDVLNKIAIKVKGNSILLDFKMDKEDVERLRAHRDKIALR
jgi:hypothetical protein